MLTKLQKEVKNMSQAQKRALMTTGSIGLARTAPGTAKLKNVLPQSKKKGWLEQRKIRTSRTYFNK